MRACDVPCSAHRHDTTWVGPRPICGNMGQIGVLHHRIAAIFARRHSNSRLLLVWLMVKLHDKIDFCGDYLHSEWMWQS